MTESSKSEIDFFLNMRLVKKRQEKAKGEGEILRNREMGERESLLNIKMRTKER